MSIKITKKRFIAGAVCPECRELDRIVVEYALVELDDNEMSRRRCVSCGFADEFGAEDLTGTLPVPRGRPEKRRDDSAAQPVQAVRILDPGKR